MTTKQRLFIEHFKACKNASEAARQAGYAPKSAPETACKLLKAPRIAKILQEWEQEEAKRLVPQSKEDYVKQTFERSNTVKHEPTKAKYWELGGKAKGFLQDERGSNDLPTFQIVAKELHIHQNAVIPANTTNSTPHAIDISTFNTTTNDSNVQIT